MQQEHSVCLIMRVYGAQLGPITLNSCLCGIHLTVYKNVGLMAVQSELAMLRAEVRTLADQLKDAENLASSQVSCLYGPVTAASRHTTQLLYTGPSAQAGYPCSA